MSTTSDSDIINQYKSGHCRFAYAINNYQPVRCSFISDQPLFYMDFEGDIEDDLLDHDTEGFAAIEQSIAALQQKITTMENPAENPTAPEGAQDSRQMERFFEAAAFVTQPAATPEYCAQDAARLGDILSQSRLAAAYLAFARQHKTSFIYNDQIPTAHYDREQAAIYINPRLDQADQLLLAARELRRLWQHRNGAMLHPLTFHPDQAVLVNRAQIADLAGSMIRIAWELQLADHRAAWERLEQSSMADLAHAFAREAYLDFRTLNNGIAASAVFEAWFLSDRCRQQDRKLIQLMLADYQGYVFEGENVSRTVGNELIIALGTMPFGKNYLAPYVGTIVSDAVFTEIRDRSNANFLWFIKFERSFREAEQELQGHENNARDDHHESLKNNKKRLGKNEKEKIITLHGEDDPAFVRKSANGGLSGGAQIIAFRHRTGGE